MSNVNESLSSGRTMIDIDLKPGTRFEANGKMYTVSESFAIGRFQKVEDLEEELLTFGLRSTCHTIMLEAMKMINEYRPGDAYMLLFNKVDSDRKNAKLIHYAVRLCAAYINYEGEDLRYLTDETITEKLKDWSEAGFDSRPFLIYAVRVCNELLNSYKKPIASILAEAKVLEERLQEVLDIRTMIDPPANGPAAPSKS